MSEVQLHGYNLRDSTSSDYENTRSPEEADGSPDGYVYDEEDSQDSLSDFSSIRLDGYDGNETSFGQRHNTVGADANPHLNTNGGLNATSRKRAFSNAASIGSGGEKRTATKICRVCGDKAYSYNFNVITCESCKAFFRRNANKEKDIRCPFNEQCDINLVSRRFCQRCRLQKCFRVGMKKEWIMSEEARLEKKQRIQDNRERRMAERGDDATFASSVPSTNNMSQHNQDSTPLGNAIAAPAPPSAPTMVEPTANHHLSMLPSTIMSSAPLLGQTTAELAQQLNSAHMSSGMVMDATPPTAPALTAPTFMPTNFGECPQTAANTLLTSPDFAAAAASASVAAQSIANQQQQMAAHFGKAQAQFAAVQVAKAAQVAQVAQAAQAAQVVQAQIQQAQFEQALSNEVHQIHQQAAQLQQQAQQIVAHQQQMQQQQLAAAVVAAAASAMQQAPALSASSLSTGVPNVPPPGVTAAAADLVAAASAPTLPSVLPLVTPSVAANVAQIVPPMEMSQPPPPNPSQEMIAVPKDVLIKLVEQKIENEQQQQQVAQQEAKPVKCQCKCQCGRYPSDLLIVDKVMTDLLASSSQHNSELRSESAIKRENTESGVGSLVSLSEPMETNINDSDYSPLTPTDNAYLNEIHQANAVWSMPCEGPTNDDALRRLIRMLGRITGFRILGRQDQITLVRNTCEEYFILRSAMAQATRGMPWLGPPLGYPLNADAQAAILEKGLLFHNALRDEWRNNESIMLLLGLLVLFNPELTDLHSRESVAAENRRHRSLLKKTLFTLRQDPQRAYLEYCELMNKLSDLKLALGRLNTDTVEPLMREIYEPTTTTVTFSDVVLSMQNGTSQMI